MHTLIKITPVAYGCQVEIMMIKVKKILSMMKIKVKKVLKPGFSFNYFLFNNNNNPPFFIIIIIPIIDTFTAWWNIL